MPQKIFLIIHTLSAPQLLFLHKYIEKNYAQKNVLTLWKKIKSSYSKKDTTSVTKEMLFDSLYPNQKYNDTRWRYLLFELNEAIDNFLISQTLQEQPHLQNQLLCKAYIKLNLQEKFIQSNKNQKRKLAEESTHSESHLLFQYFAEENENEGIKKSQHRNQPPNIEAQSIALDHWYVLQKLKIYLDALNYASIFNKTFEVHQIDDILSQKQQYRINPLLAVYFDTIDMILTDNEESYGAVKKELLKNILSDEDYIEVSTIVRNFCIKKINKGVENYRQELFELFQIEIAFLEKQNFAHFQATTYKNMISLAFGMKQYEWALNFIETKTQFIEKDQQESLYHYNIARYYFHQKDYDKVIENLIKVNHKDVFLMLNAKTQLLKAYYEIKEIWAFNSLVQSFKILLKRKNVLAYHRTNYNNFITFANRIFQAQLENNDRELRKIKAQLNDITQIIDKDWLLSKLD